MGNGTKFMPAENLHGSEHVKFRTVLIQQIKIPV
jgi:hypothetical protein